MVRMCCGCGCRQWIYLRRYALGYAQCETDVGCVSQDSATRRAFCWETCHDFDPAKDSVPYDQLPELDRDYAAPDDGSVCGCEGGHLSLISSFSSFRRCRTLLRGRSIELLPGYCERSAVH